jgi:hypothetical protein
MKASATGFAVLAWMVLLLAPERSAAKSPDAVQIELFSGRPQDMVTVRKQADLAPVLDKMLVQE